MSVFTFIIMLVLISTVGKALSNRQASPQLPPSDYRPTDVRQLQDSVNDLSTRVEKIEEERDFYRALLEAPITGGSLPPGPPKPPADPSDPLA